jgi:hypothetical protein
MLMKSKGTIKDVDGEYWFAVSGQASLNCNIAAHYRLPLRSINKKFGTYRNIVTHLTDSSHPLVTQVRDTYLSIMDYIHNVRIAFCADARGSLNPLGAGFRSPALDYYLWLDHIAGGFHDMCRTTLETDHHVTFEAIQSGDVKDVIPLRQWSTMHHIYLTLTSNAVDWSSYHAKNCLEYDVCGAFQGSVTEEDLERLFLAVDSSLNAGSQPEESSSKPPDHAIETIAQLVSVPDATVCPT